MLFVSTKDSQIHLKVLTFIKVKTFSFEIWLFVDDPATVEDTEATRFLLDVEGLEVGKLVHQGDGWLHVVTIADYGVFCLERLK